MLNNFLPKTGKITARLRGEKRMLNKLSLLEDNYRELTEKLSDPDVIADHNSYRQYGKGPFGPRSYCKCISQL